MSKILDNFLNRFFLIYNSIIGKAILSKIQIKVKKKYFGNKYADWCIATDNLNHKSIVYSFGVGTDISFDISLIKKYNLSIYAYDPTPRSIDWLQKQQISKNFIFEQVGISNNDGTMTFFQPENSEHVSFSINSISESSIKLPVNKLSTLMSKNNHSYIDILKMDIEGSEYDVLDDILEKKYFIKQILVEFHYRFSHENLIKTKNIIKKMNFNGYKIFNISPNGEEYSFIKI